MQVRIGLEIGIEGRSLAWALDHPGCFAYGANREDAVVAMGQAVPNYIEWMAKHTSQPWFNPSEIDIRLVDVYKVYQIDRAYNVVPRDGEEVNAWFRDDWRPLTAEDVEHGLQILSWSRADLMNLVAGISPECLTADPPGDEWPIDGILNHVGTGDWWYLHRLGLAEVGREELPTDIFERLRFTREMVVRTLPKLVSLDLVVGKAGEIWSPRKLLRRFVWHEMDHTIHIQKVLKALA